MNGNVIQKKENNKEEEWYARLDEVEALSQTKMAETRLEYKETFIQVTTRRDSLGDKVIQIDNNLSH